MAKQIISDETKNEWNRDPNNWKFGFLYYNPSDNRLFPPQKIKEMGWTINFANPRSIFSVTILIASILLLTFLYKTFYEN